MKEPQAIWTATMKVEGLVWTAVGATQESAMAAIQERWDRQALRYKVNGDVKSLNWVIFSQRINSTPFAYFKGVVERVPI